MVVALFAMAISLHREDTDNLEIGDPFVREITEIWSEIFFERKIVSKEHFLSLSLLQNSLITTYRYYATIGFPWAYQMPKI